MAKTIFTREIVAGVVPLHRSKSPGAVVLGRGYDGVPVHAAIVGPEPMR